MGSTNVITNQTIDEYANSMFRYEVLHDQWIEKCANYIRSILGDYIKGKTVIDYAFGRGNWSVAFIKAGAAKVIAVDASFSNVERFRKYCVDNGLQQIEVMLANAVEAPLNINADMLWLYGILHHVEEASLLIERLAACLRSDDACIVAYAYDKESLREWLVETVRSVLTYPDEMQFRKSAYEFIPAARLRARDDLTAPYIAWYNKKDLAELFAPFGWYPQTWPPSFQGFLSGSKEGSEEFSPHHVILKRHTVSGAICENAYQHSLDIEILSDLWRVVAASLPKSLQQRLAITVFNTYFSCSGNIENIVYQLFQLFYYIVKEENIDEYLFSSMTKHILNMADRAINRRDIDPPDQINGSMIARALKKNGIRI